MDGLQREVVNLKANLRAFEKAFVSKHGRVATRKDVAADAEASAWFRRYEVLKARAAPRVTAPAAPPVGAGAPAPAASPREGAAAGRTSSPDPSGPTKDPVPNVVAPASSGLRKGEVDREVLRHLVKASEHTLEALREAIEKGGSVRAKRILGLAIALRGRQSRATLPRTSRQKVTARRPGPADPRRAKRRKGRRSGESDDDRDDDLGGDLGDLDGFIASESDEAGTAASEEEEEEEEAGSDEELQESERKLSKKGLGKAVAKFLEENSSLSDLKLKELRKRLEEHLGYSLKDRKREFAEAAKAALLSGS